MSQTDLLDTPSEFLTELEVGPDKPVRRTTHGSRRVLDQEDVSLACSEAAKIVAGFVSKSGPFQTIFEVNPGQGFLSKELLKLNLDHSGRRGVPIR